MLSHHQDDPIFKELVNKYGWLNWANQLIDVGIYDYLETFNEKFGLKLDPFEREKNFLSRALNNYESPYVAVIGGAKVSTKLELIKCISSVADYVIVGG